MNLKSELEKIGLLDKYETIIKPLIGEKEVKLELIDNFKRVYLERYFLYKCEGERRVVVFDFYSEITAHRDTDSRAINEEGKKTFYTIRGIEMCIMYFYVRFAERGQFAIQYLDDNQCILYIRSTD